LETLTGESAALDAWFEASSAQLLDEFEHRLEERLQRLEALTRLIVTLVNEPLDALTQNVREIANRPPGAEGVRADVTAAINELIAEGQARDAMLKALLAKVDELTEVIVG
jgi:hypothetical protein